MSASLIDEQNRDRSAYFAAWHQKNRERRLSKMRADYHANPEKKIAETKKYHQEHPEVGRKSWRKYQEKNRELCREKSRDWYQRNLESQRARCREKRRKAFAENPEKILATNRAWAGRNKNKIRARDMRRRALLKGAAVNLKHIQEWVSEIKSKRSVTCYYCGETVPTNSIHLDHIIPLSKGGLHAVENLCVSCRTCNLRKGAKGITAWVKIGQQILSL